MHARRLLTAALLAATFGVAPLAQAQTVYALANAGATLIRFEANNPASVTIVGDFAGPGASLDAIDFRPLTGQLFGYSDATDAFYTINPFTAQTSPASSVPAGALTDTRTLGLDFNPTIDRARVVTDTDRNIVFNPNAGTSAAFTTLFYPAGDPNAGADPMIVENAYTQNFAGSMMTRQYAIDARLDVLVTLANNAGTLGTVGALGVDTGINTGFDISTDAQGVDTAFALLASPGGTTGFYTIDLSTGAATLVGPLGFTGPVSSLAVVPAPGAACVLAGAGAALLRRRR